MFNPFPTSETISYYTNFEELDFTADNIPDVLDREENKILPTSLFEFSIKIVLGEVYNIEVRQRYNIWDLLGDVGGFHDGLIIVFSLFMGSYSALAFKIDYLKST